MRNFDIFIFIIIIILLLCSCRAVEHKDENPEPGTCPLPVINYDYNPQKAGAEIVQRIDAPAGLFVTWTNGHYYMVAADKIVIFDIQNGEMRIIKAIPYQLEQLCPEIEITKEFLHSFGIVSFDDRFIFGLYTPKIFMRFRQEKSIAEKIFPQLKPGYRSFYGILSLNDDGSQLCFEDMTSDLTDSHFINAMYYNETTEQLYIGEIENSNRVDKRTVCYHYNTGTSYFEKQNEYKIKNIGYEIFITDKYFITANYGFRYRYLVDNQIDIRLLDELDKLRTVDLFALGLHYPPLSVFSDDDGNIWLYEREYDSETKQDKYELLKLKLLE